MWVKASDWTDSFFFFFFFFLHPGFSKLHLVLVMFGDICLFPKRTERKVVSVRGRFGQNTDDTEQIQTAKRFKIVKSEEEAKDAIKTNPPHTHTHVKDLI